VIEDRLEGFCSAVWDRVVSETIVITVVAKSAAVYLFSVTLGICVASRYLAMTVFSDFTAGTMFTQPLAGSGRLLQLRYSGFQPSRHIMNTHTHTSVRHCTLSWVNSVQLMPEPISKFRFNVFICASSHVSSPFQNQVNLFSASISPYFYLYHIVTS
jgi:hypothetical protein